MNNAKWITYKNQAEGTMLYSFRKKFVCNGADSFKIRISADSRYKLYINGCFASEGPCRSSGKIKYYEEFNGASLIKEGENVIEAVVLNIKEEDTWASIIRTGNCALWFDGLLVNNGKEISVISDADWECARMDYHCFHPAGVGLYIVNQYETINLQKKNLCYKKCDILYTPEPNFCSPVGSLDKYYLQKRPIPEMYFGAEEGFVTDKSDVMPVGNEFIGFIAQTDKGYIELDAKRLVTADFKLKFKAIAGCYIKITYSECRYPQNAESAMTKGVRDDYNGKLIGDYDEIISNGEAFEFNPYSSRAFRYIRIDFENASELEIYSCKFRHYHYPISDGTKFNCSDETFNKMWHISVDTVINCMHEIIEDCPYHEQEQYIADSALTMQYIFRIHSDCRLAKKAILEFCDSIHSLGFASANYPSQYVQVIPGFSLLLIKMIYDYYMNSGDIELVKKTIGACETIFNAFVGLMDEDGLICSSQFWDFIDWVDGWDYGVPSPYNDKPLTIHNMMYAAALKYMAEIYEFIGRSGSAQDYYRLYEKYKGLINSKCYNKAEGLYENRGGSNTYSQHNQVWAVLGGLVTGDDAKKLLLRMLAKDGIDKCSFSMSFYVLRALSEAGLYEKSDIILEQWRKMMDLHLTTWSESISFPRSECHGWSSAPLYELSAEYLGVKPIEPGFKTLLIKPFTATLDYAQGEVPTPYGKIYVSWKKQNGKVVLNVNSPKDVTKKIVSGEKTITTNDICIEVEI